MDSLFYKKNYPFSQKYYEENLKRLNDKNITIRDNVMLRDETFHNKAKISDEEKGLPDSDTRLAILKIHLDRKPYDKTIILEDLVDVTLGMSAAEIENMLNEAMLYEQIARILLLNAQVFDLF
tara:strand:+ start:343 stop:711 length:369 start_codon:yes stop_codon:yes gene_type:complete